MQKPNQCIAVSALFNEATTLLLDDRTRHGLSLVETGPGVASDVTSPCWYPKDETSVVGSLP